MSIILVNKKALTTTTTLPTTTTTLPTTSTTIKSKSPTTQDVITKSQSKSNAKDSADTRSKAKTGNNCI